MQPVTLPRPDMVAIGTRYRRIPILSIGRDIYNDTRLILRKLETLYPSTGRRISGTTDDERAIEQLLEYWAVDGGIFMKAAGLLPSDMPLLRDPKFTKDREDFTGTGWTKENIDRGRPEAAVGIKQACEFLEGTMLADGREWILKTGGPSLADIEGMCHCSALEFGWASLCYYILTLSYDSQLFGHTTGSGI